ncbi:MAG: ATP-binding cassette domain-containing protein, partial [Deltaproteobacteria bacterium]|nr:ATP-binding cassette domain-containing protein [Deltaproteobacteria bacterium]
MAHLKVENLSISFGGLRALGGVSFEVRPGEIYSIIGPNGAGKTTVFNCISGIYKPNEGKILFKDLDLTPLKPHQVAQA